jgi:hypothetical protein
MADFPVTGFTNPLGVPRLMDAQEGDIGILFPVKLNKQGGIGFQYEGGIIIVTASPTGIDVSFDRPMSYDGSFGNNGPNDPFSIGQPILDGGNARTLEIPVSVNVIPPTVSAVTPTSSSLEITFSTTVTPTELGLDVGSYVITGGPNTVRVLAVNFYPLLNKLVLSTSEQRIGASYTLTAKKAVVVSDFNVANNSFSLPFTGVGLTPTIVSAVAETRTKLVVTFSEPVNDTALDTTKYSFVPTLGIVSIERLSTTKVRITTTEQVLNTIYSLTASGVQDLAQNPS